MNVDKIGGNFKKPKTTAVDTEQLQMENGSEEATKSPAQTTKQLLKLLKLQKERAKLRRKITRIKNYL